MWSSQKILIVTFTFLVMAMSQEASGAEYSNEQIANIIQQFNETLEADKLEKVPVLLTVTSSVISIYSTEYASINCKKILSNLYLNHRQPKNYFF